MWNKIKTYVISISIALATGALSAFISRRGMDIYSTKIQPPLSPPMALFPVVWSVLYILMGIGSALVFKNRKNDPQTAATALKIYGLQLIVNFFWSIIFFNMQSYLFAFIWLIILLILILIMTVMFSKINKTSAILQIPYILWVSFAGYLTFMVWFLNR